MNPPKRVLQIDLLVEEVGLTVLFVLAFANGANDVGKSVASLMSTSGPGGPRLGRRPLLWGGVFSGLGSISAILISGRLLTVFTLASILRPLPRRPQTQTPEKNSPRFAKISHWGSAAATAYARGINDAPKMAALGAFFFVAGSTYAVWGPYSIVAVAIVAGSLVLGHRVALELVKRVVPLDHTQRLQAGIVTAALVSVGAYLGAPLSTTHVHAGSTAGIGGRKEVIVSALRGMVLPWLVTLPAAGLLAVTVAILVARL